MRAAILFVLVCASCSAPAAAVPPRLQPPPAPAAAIAPRAVELRLALAELSCRSCAGFIAEGTARIPGVLTVSAVMLDHLLVVRYDPTQLSEATLIAAIDAVVDRLAN